MKSIRSFLLVSVLSVVVLCLIIFSLTTYFEAKHEVEEIYDAQLAQSARMLHSLLINNLPQNPKTTSPEIVAKPIIYPSGNSSAVGPSGDFDDDEDADEDNAIQLFLQALERQPNLAVLHNEFAQVILRLDDSDYDDLLLKTLVTCDSLTVYSAEEALNQKACRALLSQLKK